jgi:hypothetical protein
MIATRTCKKCNLVSEDLSLFVKDKQSKYGRRNLCISCAVKINEQHPKKKDWKTEYQVRKRYNISLHEYLESMSSAGACQICSSTKNLCYDHDHVTMKFRGILCCKCNRAIGQLGDTAESLQKAVDYLKRKRIED